MTDFTTIPAEAELEEYMDVPEAADPEAGEWMIENDQAADWAVRKIAEERAEYNRIKELAEAEIVRINAELEAAQKRCDNGTKYLTMKLAEYFGKVPHRATKTKESYRLLSGTLTMKKGGTIGFLVAAVLSMEDRDGR